MLGIMKRRSDVCYISTFYLDTPIEILYECKEQDKDIIQKVIEGSATVKEVERLDIRDIYSLYQHHFFNHNNEKVSYLTHLLKHMCKVQKYYWEEN